MAIVEVPKFYKPTPINWLHGADPDFLPQYMETGARGVGFVFRVPKGGTLERFEFNIGAITQKPANGLKASFQNVTAGLPDGTATYYYTIPTGSISANTWTIPPYITDDGTDNGNRKTVSHGDLLACVIEFVSFQASDFLVIQSLPQDDYGVKGAYTTLKSNLGVWGPIEGGSFPVLALVYEGDEYVSLVDAYAIYDILVNSTYADGEVDEVGMAFQLTAPQRVGGAYVLVDPLEDFDVILYDEEAGEELERVRVEIGSYVPNNQNIDYVLVHFTHDHLIQANQFYVLSVAPIGTTDTVGVYYIQTYSAAQMAGMPCGVNWHYRDRADASDWREVDNLLPLFGLLVTGVDHEIGGSPSTGWEGNP